MRKFRIRVFFQSDKTVIVSAKNQAQAKLKAYNKFDKKKASSLLIKSQTEVEDSGGY